MNRICINCNKNKDLSCFWPRKTGISDVCRECKREKRRQKYKVLSPEYKKNMILQHKFGITLDNYNSMLSKQNQACDICKKPEFLLDYQTGKTKALSVDHSHETGAVRALLCDSCNRALGLVKENFDTALNMARYIQEHKGII